jgi:hypothetical protein
LVQILDVYHAPLAQVAPRFPLPSMRNPGHWTATPDFARILAQLIHQHQPKIVVELGSGV